MQAIFFTRTPAYFIFFFVLPSRNYDNQGASETGSLIYLYVFFIVLLVSWSHFPDENLLFVKINCEQNLEHSAESCLPNYGTKEKKTAKEWTEKKSRAREKRENKIMQMRFLCGAYAFCILHFGMYNAYTANKCHIKIAQEFSFSLTRILSQYQRDEEKKKILYQSMHMQKLLQQRLFSSLHNCKCFIHSKFYFLALSVFIRLLGKALYSVCCKYFIRI